MNEFKTVTIVGLGYIGLPTAAVVASRGMKVTGVDINERVVKTIASGRHSHRGAGSRRPRAKSRFQRLPRRDDKPKPADVFIIAVPTPIDHERRPDLKSVIAATDSIVDLLAPGNLLIIESTVPIGTTEKLAERIREKRPDLAIGDAGNNKPHISIAYCPERVLPGRIITELVNNDRCIGGITPACAREAQRFYRAFVRGACIATTARAAEMVKLTENAFRDTNIAFANELSLICDRHGINVWEVIELANRHPRVNILRPGPGVGGHCIAVDPWFIVDSAPELARLIKTSREVNDSKIASTVDRVVALIEKRPAAKLACFGLAFKANVDDLRESPALEIAQQLAARYGARVKIVEPHIRELPPELAAGGAELIDIEQALKTCQIAVLLVDHDRFKAIPLAERCFFKNLSRFLVCSLYNLCGEEASHNRYIVAPVSINSHSGCI